MGILGITSDIDSFIFAAGFFVVCTSSCDQRNNDLMNCILLAKLEGFKVSLDLARYSLIDL
jgi:hypothetical protein